LPLHLVTRRGDVAPSILLPYYLSWNRAKALAALNRHADSLPDWDRALELATPEQKVEIQVGRSVSAVKAVKLPEQKNDKPNP
jgi:hypothetical protein